jgi:1-acyl-sn-glycerol-3-phosphate acyltransferase
LGVVKPALKTLSYACAKALSYPLMLLYFRVRVRGGARLPRKGGFLLAANHFSFVDPLILGAMLPRRLWFVMAEDQFDKPGVHLFSRLMDVIPVQAGAAFKLGPIRKCLSVLRGGRVVAIFPEGRRSPTGRILPPMPGVGVLAGRAGVPVIPVAIGGTREAYPPGRRFPRPGKVTLVVGEPLTGLDALSPEEVARRAMDAIAGLLVANGYSDYVEATPCGVSSDQP